MTYPYSNDDRFDPNDAPKMADAARQEPMDDEEKVIANRPDANMPALLTRDVLGG